MIELGKKIKMVREYNDLSQEELGTIVQKTKSTIGRYEKGLMEIPAKVIIDLCNYYQLSLDAFVESTYYAGHQAHMEKNTELKRGGLAALDPQQLVNYFNMLPDSAKTTIFAYMEIEVATRSSQDMMLPSSEFYKKPPMFGYIAVYYYNFLSEHAKNKVLSYMEIEILATGPGAQQE
ncbi:MAG: helix-turn-helix transcriptional regulator [Enterocloster asparagiformis]|nr:helix-turn-helix transcriptional regulator [Enterocloster asparagiformis]